MPIGIDLDEVISPLISPHCLFLNKKYGCNLTEADFHTYDFWNHYSVTMEQAVKDFYEFTESEFFQQIEPFAEAKPQLERLAKLDALHVITARQDFLKRVTMDFIQSNFPGVFSKIDFGNFFGKTGKRTEKTELCYRNNIYLLVEDDPKHIVRVARDIPVIVFDKPWNRNLEMARNTIRAYNWQDIGDITQEFLTNPGFLI